MADVPIVIRGITPASNNAPGTDTPGPGHDTTTTVSLASHAATAVGDHLLVLATCDYVSSLTVDAANGVGSWQLLASSDSGTTMLTRAWLGRVDTAGPRTVTVRQNGSSGLHMQVWTLNAGGADIARDGTLTTVVDATTPYSFGEVVTAGTASLLVAFHGIVQFSGTLNYGAAPAGMTTGAEHYFNQYAGQQAVYQQLAAAGGTGSRALTSNIASGDGGAGAMFALRAQSTVDEVTPPAGPVAVDGPAATVQIVDPRVKASPPAGPVSVDGPAPTVAAVANPPAGLLAVDGPPPSVAFVYPTEPGVVAVSGPAAFGGGTLAQPGGVTVTGPPAQAAFGGQQGPSQLGVQQLPPAQPTRVIAQNIRTGEFLHMELPVDDLEVTEVLSGPQVITGKFPTEIRDLRDVDLEPWGTWIHVEEDGVVRASGILQPAQIDQNETLTFDAVGVSAYPQGITYQGDFTLSGTDPASGETGVGVGLDPADIVRDIWAHVQAYDDGDLGVTVIGATGVRVGTPPRDVDFQDSEGQDVSFVAGPYSKLDWWEAQDCGSEIDSLASDTPFDFVERQAWNTGKTGVDHWIEIGWPRIGGAPDVLFAEEQNLLAAVGPEEPDGRYASEVVVLGKGEGTARVRGYAGRPLGTRLRRPKTVDDKTIESVPAANRRARIELEACQALADITEVTAEARHINATLGAYSVGDDVPVESGDLPWVGSLRVMQRVLSITYAPGAESVKLMLRSSSSFRYGGTGA